jgi:hypothetical protein
VFLGGVYQRHLYAVGLRAPVNVRGTGRHAFAERTLSRRSSRYSDHAKNGAEQGFYDQSEQIS